MDERRRRKNKERRRSISFSISSPALAAEPFGLQDSALIANDGLRAWEI